MKAHALHGHLDALILATVETGALHGYAIAEALSARSDGALEVATGTLYPALRRLEAAGLLAGSWSVVDGRNRRTYELTDAGSRALRGERAAWRALANVVEAVLKPA